MKLIIEINIINTPINNSINTLINNTNKTSSENTPINNFTKNKENLQRKFTNLSTNLQENTQKKIINRIEGKKMLRNSGNTANKTIKKLVIKNFKEVPLLPANFEEEAWKKLEETVKAIFNQTAIQNNKESLYNDVKDLCSHKFSGEMFSRLRKLIEDHLNDLSNNLLIHLNQSFDQNSFLIHFNEIWNNHCDQIRMIRNIFLYLDRTYVIQLNEIRSIWDLGLHLFSTKILSIPSISSKLLEKMFFLIRSERNGEIIPRSIIQSIIRMLISLDHYFSLFEENFLKESKEYYDHNNHNNINFNNINNGSADHFERKTISEYLHYIDQRLKEEIDRGKKISLEKSTVKSLIAIVENELITCFALPILDKGFEKLIEENCFDDLSLLFSFFDRAHLLHLIDDYFAKFVKVFIFIFFYLFIFFFFLNFFFLIFYLIYFLFNLHLKNFTQRK